MTLLDVATPGPGQYLDRLKVVLPQTDIFVPNTDEAELILGESDPVRQARVFRELGARRVVITLGDRGVISFSDGLQVRVGVYPIQYVDGSGGGDAFNAGYILGLLEGRSELDCLKLASAVGAVASGPSGPRTVFSRVERPRSSSHATNLSSSKSIEFRHVASMRPRRGLPNLSSMHPRRIQISRMTSAIHPPSMGLTNKPCRVAALTS